MKPLRAWLFASILVILFLLPSPASSQGLDLRWSSIFDHPTRLGDDEFVNQVAVDPVGNVFVAGSSHDERADQPLVLKYSALDGSKLWECLVSTVLPHSSSVGSMVVAPSGDVIVAGRGTENNGNASFVAKLSGETGQLLWSARFPFGSSAKEIACDAAGSIYFVGQGEFPAYENIRAVKLHGSDGSQLWNVLLPKGTYRHLSASYLALDSGDGLILSGYASTSSQGTVFYTAKLSKTTGSTVWTAASTPGLNDRVVAATIDPSNDVVVAGYASASGERIHVVKYSGNDGSILWERLETVAAQSSRLPGNMAVDSAGNVLLVGHHSSSGLDQAFVGKYAAATGALLWEKSISGASRGVSVKIGPSDSIVAVALAVNGLNENFTTVKYSREGNMLWSKTSTGVGLQLFAGAGAPLVIDLAGNVVITGRSLHGQDSDNQTLKYASNNGDLLWQSRYSGISHFDDAAIAVAFDPAGNVVVTGYSHNGNDLDCVTAKYAAGTGALLWRVRYDGGVSDDRGQSVVVDAGGNVYLTASSFALSPGGVLTHRDIYTAKYSAADGSLLWEKRFDAGRHDFPIAIALTPDGDVYVAGKSDGVDDARFCALKYAGDTGILRWSKRNTSGTGHRVTPSAAAVDASGNLVITGWAPGAAGSDFYTVFYAAVDGAIHWEKKYEGTAALIDEAYYAACDSEGNVVVSGYSQEKGSPARARTLKYAGVDGTILWSKSHGGPLAARVPYEGGLVITPENDVIVAANDHAKDSILKLARSSGETLWEQFFNPQVVLRSLCGLALDSFGNVVATGFNGNGTNQFYSAKFSGATGASLGAAAFPSPLDFGQPAESPQTIAAGPAGTIAIVGVAKALHADFDWQIVCYEPGNSSPTLALLGDSPLILEAAATFTDPGATASDFEDGNLTPILIENTVIPTVPGDYVVRWSATDSESATTTVVRSVKVIDTTAPAMTAVSDLVVPTTNPAGTSVDFNLPTASDLVGVASVTASPASGSHFSRGATLVTLTARDAAGNSRTATFSVSVVLSEPASSLRAVSGAPVPGAGVDDRIPAGATWTSFGVPAISPSGKIAFVAKWSAPAPGKSGTGLFLNDTLLVRQGDSSPLASVAFRTLRTPVFATDSDDLLLPVTLGGIGVHSGNDSAIAMFSPAPRIVLREGNSAGYSDASKVASISAAAASENQTLLLVKLKGGRPAVTATNKVAVLSVDSVGATTPLIRTKDSVAGEKITSLRLLASVAGSTGHGRNDYAGARLRFIAELTNRKMVIAELTAPGQFAVHALSGEPVNEDSDARWKGFQAALSNSADGNSFAFLGTLQTGVTGLFLSEQGRIEPLVRLGAPAPAETGGTFSKLTDPVLASDGSSLAFLASLRRDRVTLPGLFAQTPGEPLTTVALVSEAPPGLPTARWLSFQSVSVPGGGVSLLFTASLKPGKGGITARNDKGVWAIDTAGTLRNVLREGDFIAGKEVKSFEFLKAVTGTPGVARAYNAQTEIVWRANFYDHSSAVIVTTIP